MGPTLVFAFLAVFTLAIGQAIVRRRLNPYDEVAYDQLPGPLRAEIERVLPGYQPRLARATRKRNEVKVEGEYLGEPLRVDADFDARGELVEFEVDGPRGSRTRGLASAQDIPAHAAAEIDRVLGNAAAAFQHSVVKTGESAGEPTFEVKGRAGDWIWEIEVSASGRLLEVEKEKRRRQR